jgi:hypothetical protein
VKQKDENKQQPTIDLDHSLDRTYMNNRHQSQFIGQDLLSRLHLTIKSCHIPDSDADAEMDYFPPLDEEVIMGHQRRNALFDTKEQLVDDYLNEVENEDDWAPCKKDHELGYCEHLVEQTKQDSGTSLFRILSAKDRVIDRPCNCPLNDLDMGEVRDLIQVYNHLIFDFDTHRLTVEHLPDVLPYTEFNSLLENCVRTLQRSAPPDNPMSFYRVNIEKLAKETEGFNHTSCNCMYPALKVDQFSFLDYTYLSHVHLTVAQNIDQLFILATYRGIAAL